MESLVKISMANFKKKLMQQSFEKILIKLMFFLFLIRNLHFQLLHCPYTSVVQYNHQHLEVGICCIFKLLGKKIKVLLIKNWWSVFGEGKTLISVKCGVHDNEQRPLSGEI